MLSGGDWLWLAREHPGLSIDAGGRVIGEVAFTATYNKNSGRFRRIAFGIKDDVGGISLTGSFRIVVAPPSVGHHSRLPTLTVEGVERLADRHFNQSDGSACLCNVLEEDEFLTLGFEEYFERLVVPFLYGQLYFSQEGRWPWFDYAHGSLGTIESFSTNPTFAKAEECLRRISGDKKLWKSIRRMLLQKAEIGGHQLCPCSGKKHLRRCHPIALKGLRLLRSVVRSHQIPLPPE